MEDRKKIIRTITILIIAGAVTYAFSGALLNTLINQIIDEFNLTGTNEGIMASLQSLGMMIAIFICPAIQGRFKKLTMLFASGIIMIVSMAMGGFSQSAVMFGIACLILGIGWGLFDTYANSSIIDLYPDDNAKPMGLFHGFYGIGSLIMPLIISALLSALLWRGMYFLVAALMLVVMIIFYVVKRKVDRSGGLSETEEQKLKLKDIGAYLRKKRNILILVLGLLITMGQAGTLSWIVRYMTLEYDAQTLGTLCITIFWICATVNRFVMPYIKIPKKTMIAGGTLVFGIALLAGILVNDPVFMCVMVGVAGLAGGHLVPFTLILAAEGYQGNTTLTTSVLQFAFGIGRVIVPILIAFVKTEISMKAGMCIPVAASFIALIICLFISSGKPAEDKK